MEPTAYVWECLNIKTHIFHLYAHKLSAFLTMLKLTTADFN